jgi:hypothetical protein
MLNPLIDSENITKSQQQKPDDKLNQTGDTSDCSWCIYCDLNCLFMCCSG